MERILPKCKIQAESETQTIEISPETREILLPSLEDWTEVEAGIKALTTSNT